MYKIVLPITLFFLSITLQSTANAASNPFGADYSNSEFTETATSYQLPNELSPTAGLQTDFQLGNGSRLSNPLNYDQPNEYRRRHHRGYRRWGYYKRRGYSRFRYGRYHRRHYHRGYWGHHRRHRY